MDFEVSFFLLFFFFFALMTSCSVLCFLAYIARLRRWCKCETCQSFLTSSWLSTFSNLCDWYSHLLQNSPTGTIHVHVLGNVITANPENVEYILKTRFQNYPKGRHFSAILGDLLGRGIFNVDNDLWKFQRKMSTLELGSVSVRSYAFNIVSSEIWCRLIPLLSSFAGKETGDALVDLQDVFRRFSFDSICRFSFGLDPGCLQLSLPITKFAEAFDLASKLSAERAMTASPFVWKVKRFFGLGTEKQLKEAIKLIDLLAMEVIKHKRNTGLSKQDDLLSRFMGSIDDDKFLRDIVISFLLAGRDTVASALTTLFWLLSKHPEALENIREESDGVMGRTDDLPNFEQLKRMPYLQAALHESMRLYPPVQFDSKFCEENDTLPDGTFVAKGTRVTYHQYAMGRNERIWGKDCLEFRPERWLQNGVFKQANPFKYPVFQAGPRVCLGKDMALVEMKCVALSLIRRFDFQVAMPSQQPKFMPGLTATVRGGLQVRVQERTHQCAT